MIFFSGMVVSLRAFHPYSYSPLCSLQFTIKICNHEYFRCWINRQACRAWRAPNRASRRDHMTDATLRGNQLVSRWFLGIRQALVTVWFLIWLSYSTTLLRVCASQHVESNQFRLFVGLHQVSNLRDYNILNIINIRPTVIAINKIHIQPIFFTFEYVFVPSDSNWMCDCSGVCGNVTILP